MQRVVGMIRTILGRAALAAASVVLTVAALETALRFDSSAPRLLLQRDDRIGTHYLPNFAGNVDVPEAARPIYLRFNSLGFRGGEVNSTLR